jgi:hypothetical protein
MIYFDVFKIECGNHRINWQFNSVAKQIHKLFIAPADGAVPGLLSQVMRVRILPGAPLNKDMFTHPFPLDCYEAIRLYVLDYMSQFNQHDIYAERVDLPQRLQEQLDQELISYGRTTHSNF